MNSFYDKAMHELQKAENSPRHERLWIWLVGAIVFALLQIAETIEEK